MKARISTALALVAILALGAIALTGCGASTTTSTTGGETSSAPAPADDGVVTVAGSDTMVNMSQAFAEAYSTVDENVMVSVKGGGSGNGIAALINKTVVFANASREIKPEEITQAQANGVEPVSTEVAKDGLAVIVNKANKVADITVEDMGKVYRGEITNWKELGGDDAEIVLLGRDSSSGTYGFVQDEVVGKDKLYAKSMRNLQSSQAIVDETAKNPNAIGYVGLGYESDAIKALTVEGVTASVDTVLDASYPLSRPLIMISNGEPTGSAAAYLTWILGPDGQKIVTDQGFVPLSQ